MLIARRSNDIDNLASFYSSLFGYPEITTHRSPIYRCLDVGGLELGFNAPLARQLLNLSEETGRPGAANVYLTFETETLADIDSLTSFALKLGGSIVKQPYNTYYNARQCVLADPEGNIFRLNFRTGPRNPASDVIDPPWADNQSR